jgi:hypothetical protein
MGPDSEKHFFEAWSGLMFVFATCDLVPWFGIVIPSSTTEATVRKVPLREMSLSDLLDILDALERQTAGGYSGYGEDTFRGQLLCTGLMS